ncbi:hypothetical protein B0H14DRAFT_2567351 [Mycena olivaceomarginata]|nr:hypothetical protein B0H14DRAFT_2567351 [Mycena olivaceomarginata]
MTIPCMFRRIKCPVSNGADIQTHHISQSVRTDDETRNTWIELVPHLSGYIRIKSFWPAADLILLKAVEIERAVHDYSGSTWPYPTPMRALFWHLSDEDKSALREAISSGDLSVATFIEIQMTDEFSDD